MKLEFPQHSMKVTRLFFVGFNRILWVISDRNITSLRTLDGNMRQFSKREY